MSAPDHAGPPVPFPVQVPFLMRPGMARFDGMPCEPDQRAGLIRRQVLRAIGLGRLPLVCPECGNLEIAIDEATDLLVRPVAGTDRAAHGYNGGCEKPQSVAAAALQELRLQVPDDIVLMAPGKLSRAAALAVAMPSGWDPAEKLGLDFRAIHQPVPDAKPLNAGAAQLSAMICTGGPYRRYVWTLSGNDSLSQHPADQHNAVQAPRTGSDAGSRFAGIWFRVERQTTVPLPRSGYALFLIRVWQEPLAQVLAAAPGRERLLLDSLASMSDAVLAYKNLGKLRAQILGQ